MIADNCDLLPTNKLLTADDNSLPTTTFAPTSTIVWFMNSIEDYTSLLANNPDQRKEVPVLAYNQTLPLEENNIDEMN